MQIPDNPQSTIETGSRVRLRPAHNWLSKFAPLAEHRRLGTVTGRDGDSMAHVEFDVVRRVRPMSSQADDYSNMR